MSESHENTPFEDEEAPVASETSDSLSSLRNEMADLCEKVDQMLQHIAATTNKNNRVEDGPEDEDHPQEVTMGNKRPRDADDEPQPSNVRIRLNPGAAGSVNYVAKTKEPNVPLPDPYDGNPRHLKEFLTELDLCFRASPSKYATDKVKIIVA